MAALSQSVPLPTRPGVSSQRASTPNPNPYDQRDLQGKAMRNWEKQKRVWSNVEANIQRRVNRNGKARGAYMNMGEGVYQTRLREEELALVGNAVPSSIFSGVYTWESTLRASEDGAALRYLKFGRSNFPYPLYVKVTDRARVDPDHLQNTRIVFQHEQLPKDSNTPTTTVTTTTAAGGGGAHFGTTTTTTTTTIASTTTTTTTNVDEDDDENEDGDEVSTFAATRKHSQEALANVKPVSFSAGNYYEEKMKRYLPIIEERMSHFFLPRAYLEVCGKPPVWTTNVEDAKAAKKAAPAVVHIPPPPTKTSPTTTSLNQTKTALATQKQQQEKVKSRLPSMGDPAMRAVSMDVAASSDQEPPGELILEISSTRLLFFASPGELAHGFVKIKNNGMMTVYYTWEAHQPITALDGDLAAEDADDKDKDTEEEEEEEEDDDEGAGKYESPFQSDEKEEVEDSHKNVNGNPQNHLEKVGENGQQPQREEEQQQQKKKNKKKKKNKAVTEQQRVPLRSLAQKSAQSKSFFCLSTPFDGVILPGDEEIFPFSVRAPFPGRFTQHYEFLVIPVLSSRIIVELCAIVQDGGPSLEAISRPIANAIGSKAVVDTQRAIINELVANDDVYEAVEIEKATQEQITLARAPEVAREALTSKWREAWNEFTYTSLRIPFNCDVYARLDALHSNLARTMDSLGQPLHHKEWDGSVQTLQADLCILRDAPSRNILREALNVLLQAASVSEQETEPLDLLLQRVAGTTAFTILAQRTCELDDTIAFSLGLRSPRSAQTAPALQISRSLGSAGMMTATPGAMSGASASINAPTGGRKGISSANSVGKASGKVSGRGKGTVPHDSTAGFGASVSAREAIVEELMAFAESLGGGDISVDTAIKEEYNTRFFLGMRRLVGDAIDRICATWDSSRSSVEAACGLSLLDTVENMRADDVRVIQAADEIDIDFTVEVIQPKRRK
ncbi:uncharacterized protein TM35_000132390 [Trypanosoma theileri]|uniref:Uncharacterized protein n=1 Tax=Trypanosoma theileri TaxID=67003 RepID=A0A1X0NX14_9TRYP|nr:uncharacterized protein TM35_000132390 [Trypanosoma theileri]ORC89235.1 hypothetical protein TM35_000132390 [Trypanosoma theileri]